jgi:virulence factor
MALLTLMGDFNYMRKTARICIKGNGRFANAVHYPSLTSLKDVAIVGISAFDEDRLKQTTYKYKISEKSIHLVSSQSEYQKILIDLKPDGVFVIGPPERMFDI